jgi:hypothetical protein
LPTDLLQPEDPVGGLGISELKPIREIETEHSKFKRMYADLAMENDDTLNINNNK